jgi:hypothetical protein
MGDPPIEKLLSQRYVTATYKKIPEIPHDIPAILEINESNYQDPPKKKDSKKSTGKSKRKRKTNTLTNQTHPTEQPKSKTSAAMNTT